MPNLDLAHEASFDVYVLYESVGSGCEGVKKVLPAMFAGDRVWLVAGHRRGSGAGRSCARIQSHEAGGHRSVGL
jgi:hypothetical protein